MIPFVVTSLKNLKKKSFKIGKLYFISITAPPPKYQSVVPLNLFDRCCITQAPYYVLSLDTQGKRKLK